ncbi:MAG: hypothetical protein R2788_07010 [Saprospiraceae bacterium]
MQGRCTVGGGWVEPNVFSFDQQPILPNVTSEVTFELEMELDGCISENIAVTTVSLNPKPSAFPVFDYQLAADCSPEDIQLKANASGMGLTYQWSGANNFTSQIENPSLPMPMPPAMVAISCK